MSERIFNFNAGPAALPIEVLEDVQKDLLNYKGEGLSVMEMSHRSKTFDSIIKDAESGLKKIMSLPDNYKVIFMQGGATMQFAAVPLNLLKTGQSADYINTGSWSKKAIQEAQKLGIFGTQWQDYPDTGNIPLICDMSSDINCREVDISKFALIYAGAQKNMGPSGVTIVIIREDLLDQSPDDIPTMTSYKIIGGKDSLYNTPPTFGIYLIKLVTEWIENMGGLKELENVNNKKAELLYNQIDNSDFYKGTVANDSRSIMNITFRLPSEDLEKQFIAETTTEGMIGLKGHRSVGGCRASIYNAVPLKALEALIDFMQDFEKKNG